MSGNWDDFDDSFKTSSEPKTSEANSGLQKQVAESSRSDENASCQWGFRSGPGNCVLNDEDADGDNDCSNSDTKAMIVVYEKYLDDKQSFLSNRTSNHSKYVNNAQKLLQEWFEREGHEYDVETDSHNQTQFICSLRLPIGDQDFEVTSDASSTKKAAQDEITLTACKLLDEVGLLFPWQADKDIDAGRKQRLMDARKEDDIEFEDTHVSKKYHLDGQVGCASTASRGANNKREVDTYESLMAKWSQTNLAILKLKAELVKINMSVKCAKYSQEERLSGAEGANQAMDAEGEDEIDPLDAYMLSLDKKTKLSIDDKIEKSRIKSDIQMYQREQERLGRLIELAKPKSKSNGKV